MNECSESLPEGKQHTPFKVDGENFSFYKEIKLFLDNPLHVILNNSKLVYRIYVILIANKELKK
jgi:hypothetical protein